MPDYSAYFAVLSHPLVITIIMCYTAKTLWYMIRIGIILTASTVITRTTDNNRREACLKLAEMMRPRWLWQHPPSK
jgi:hypothetical protein